MVQVVALEASEAGATTFWQYFYRDNYCRPEMVAQAKIKINIS
jgi:hypothetical protein